MHSYHRTVCSWSNKAHSPQSDTSLIPLHSLLIVVADIEERYQGNCDASDNISVDQLCFELDLTPEEEVIVKGSSPEKIATITIHRKTLLQIAALKGNLKVAKFLVERCQANIDEKKMLRLVKAMARSADTRNNQLDVMKYLVRKDARLKTATAANVKLHIASGRGQLQIVKYLVEECGADIQQQGIWKNSYHSKKFTQVTPLWVATYKNELDVVKYLASKGARIKTTDETERRPELHIGAGNGNLNIVKCLVEKCGADIQQQGIWKNSYQSKEFTQVTPLWVATYKNELDVVKYLASKGARVETTEIRPELHIAAGNGNLDMVKFLVKECGANIQQQGIWKGDSNQQRFSQVSPLWVATYKNELDVVKYLVSKGACIETTDSKERRPELHIAAGNGNLAMVKFLVEECGANIQQQGIWSDCNGWNKFSQVTPMWVATYKNKLDVVKYLVSKGARINTTDKTKKRPELHIAAGNGNLDMVQFLVKECGANIQQQGIWKGDSNQQRFSQVTPLWVATYKNELDVVKYLVSKGACIETTDSEERRPELHIAARNGNLAKVKFLVEECGANIQQQGIWSGRYEWQKFSQVTPLWVATYESELDVVKYLVSKGACIETTDTKERRPELHIAAGNGNLAMVKFLVEECGANIQQQGIWSHRYGWPDFSQVTPMWVATYKKKLDFVKYLVSKGARLKTTDGTEKRPELHIAAKNGNLDIVKCLVEECGANIQQQGIWDCDSNQQKFSQVTPLWVATYESELDVVKYLVSKGACIETTDSKERRPELHIAAGNGNLDMVKCLVEECGANIQQQGIWSDRDVWHGFSQVTPMWVATYKKKLDVVKYLASKGARIKTTDETEKRPELHIAVGNGNLDIVKCLVEECGANIQQQGIWSGCYEWRKFSQVTPLWVAAYESELDVVKYLVSKGACIETTDSKERRPELHIAAGNGNLAMVKFLVEECGANIQQQGIWKGGYDGDEFSQVSPLWVATYKNELDVVKYLASKGARVEKTDETEKRPELYIAAGNGNLDIVKCLVEECGANIQQQGIWSDCYGWNKFSQVTPMWVATYKNKLDVVKYLVSKGACIETTDSKERRPELHIAAGNGNLAMVKFLVEECGANIQQQGIWSDCYGWNKFSQITPMCVAAYKKQAECCQVPCQ